MYKDIPDELRRVIEPIVEAHGLELVDAQLGRGPTRSLLRVVLDTPAGDGSVTLGECAAVSREIGHNLDAQEVVLGAYLLEVCSPGVDRTLGREKDFSRALGRRVKLETREPLEGRRRFQGELVAFDGQSARLHTETGDVSIPFACIARAQAFHPSEWRATKG